MVPSNKHLLLVILAATHHGFSSALSSGGLHRTLIRSGRKLNHISPLKALDDHHSNDDCATPTDLDTAKIADLPSRRRFFATSLSKTFLAATVPFLALSTSPQLSNAAIRDPKTGILLPSVGEIESSIPTTWDEDDDPISSGDRSSFSRLDSSSDTIFYSEPRFVEHVDEQAVESMTSYISDTLLKSGDSVLDLCSSWTSHIRSRELKRAAGLGMNAKELEANSALTDWTVMDLNADKNVKLPYDDESFDVILLQLSIDYLIHPLEVMKEASRVLRKNGKVAILFSNRLFLSKAVGNWSGKDDIDHAYTVGSYLQFCGGGFTSIKAEDLSTRKQKGREKMIIGDPLYVVTATKG